jgi:C-terminal processing protease CtpA/Prc
MSFRNDNVRRLPRPGAWAAATLAVAGLLAGCGGGGGGGGGASLPLVLPTTTPATGTGGSSSGAFAPSSTVAGLCAVPRNGTNPDTGAAYPDRPGSLDSEKTWVRSWIDETYLWYTEVPANLVASGYATPVDYFNVLKTPATTASGRAKDRFHFVYDTEVYRELSQGGITAGYGMEFAFVRNSRPRDLRIAFTEPGSPAASAGIARGAKVLEVDGVDVVNGTNTTVINNGVFPATVGESHTFKLLEGSATRTVTLASAKVTSTPVQNVGSLTTGSGLVGYMLFNDHISTSEKQLVAAVNQLKTAGVQDLVLDMRYNGGGLLAIASELAYMVAAPAAGTTFERLAFNDKNPFGLTSAQATVPFYSTARGFSVSTGQPLPTLGLSRVTVLTGPDTCSASESVINSLRGVGVTVNLVGGATCGKPYGFYPQDNCGTTYFAIQFKGVNQVGFGDYGDGFAPTCSVADDFDHPLGDPNEARLAAALTLRTSGACPAVASSKAAPGLDKAGQAAPEEEQPYLLERSPLRQNRLLESAPIPG